MTIDTIKNVLTRIISINKNLTEESLHNLLVASAWDDADIKEGVNIFREYLKSGSINIAAKIEEDKQMEIDKEKLEIENKEKIEKYKAEQQEENKLEKEKFVDLFSSATSQTQELVPNNKISNNVVSLLNNDKNTNTDKSFFVAAETEKIVNNSISDLNIHENRDFLGINKMNNNEPAHIPAISSENQNNIDQNNLEHDNNHMTSYADKPIGLIILDIVLFLITLGLLGYVLFN